MFCMALTDVKKNNLNQYSFPDWKELSCWHQELRSLASEMNMYAEDPGFTQPCHAIL